MVVLPASAPPLAAWAAPGTSRAAAIAATTAARPTRARNAPRDPILLPAPFVLDSSMTVLCAALHGFGSGTRLVERNLRCGRFGHHGLVRPSCSRTASWDPLAVRLVSLPCLTPGGTVCRRCAT